MGGRAVDVRRPSNGEGVKPLEVHPQVPTTGVFNSLERLVNR